MAIRQWTPADLPASFKLFEYDFALNAKIALDGSNQIVTITDNWSGRVASGGAVGYRRPLSQATGVQSAFKSGSASDPSYADGIIVNDLTGLPSGNADRFMGFAVSMVDGIVGGYRGTGNGYYFLDSPSPGMRLTTGTTSRTAPVTTAKNTPNWVTASHASSVTTVRVNGVTVATYNVTLATVLSAFGIAGAQRDYYNLVGHTLYVVVGKRAPTQDEAWRLEWWVATNKTKKAIPTDNPYSTSPPMYDDGLGPYTGTVSVTTEDATTSSAARLYVKGATAYTTEDATITAKGSLRITGRASVTTEDALGVAIGKAPIVGAGAAQTEDAIGVASGRLSLRASVVVQTEDATGTAAGVSIVAGRAVVTTEDAIAISRVSLLIRGAVVVTTEDATGSSKGELEATHNYYIVPEGFRIRLGFRHYKFRRRT